MKYRWAFILILFLMAFVVQAHGMYLVHQTYHVYDWDNNYFLTYTSETYYGDGHLTAIYYETYYQRVVIQWNEDGDEIRTYGNTIWVSTYVYEYMPPDGWVLTDVWHQDSARMMAWWTIPEPVFVR